MSVKGEIVEKRGCYSMEWKIKEFFSTSMRVDEFWFSPSFQLSDASWCLKLYPNGKSDQSTGWISLYLGKKQSETEIHEVFYILGVKSSDGMEIKSEKVTCSFNNKNFYGWKKLAEIKELLLEKDKLFPDGTVTFFCQACLTGRKKSLFREPQIDGRDQFFGLSENFKDLFLSEVGADVTIKVKDEQFPAHSQILSARSSVFADMFKHDMKKKNSGVVEIPEFDPDAFREFLIFLYSGQAEKLSSENVIGLYSAADKYEVEDLELLCTDFIEESMTVDSFCSYLSLAITYDDQYLIEFSNDFFVENVKKIIVTAKWMSFAKKYPMQSNELFIKVARRFVPG